MKIKNMSTLTLISMLGVTMMGNPYISSAAPLTSSGTVTVEEGSAGGSDQETVDPEKPNETLPKPDSNSPKENTNPDVGALIIEKTTDLDFGKIQTSASSVTNFAKSMSFENGSKKRGAYVQWADIRSGGTNGYTLTAQLTSQFKDSTKKKVLTGATLDFSNGMIVAQSDNPNPAPSSVMTSFQLTEDENDAKAIVTAKKESQEGKGRYIMSFGQSETSTIGEKGTAGSSVLLTVPAATASTMSVDNYTAIVTWKITAAPVEE